MRIVRIASPALYILSVLLSKLYINLTLFLTSIFVKCALETSLYIEFHCLHLLSTRIFFLFKISLKLFVEAKN